MHSKQEDWSEQRRAFYVTITWIDCSRSYREAHPLCERCLKKGDIAVSEEVHHKIKLTPANINNPAITLNWANLEALCADCHKQEHKKQRSEHRKRAQRWRLNDSGDIVLADPPLGT